MGENHTTKYFSFTQELIQEKQKMEDLLYLTLPFPVARYGSFNIFLFFNIFHFRDIQLKKRVNAEKIETVTIYYSDLVDFTELYSDSTPFEVGFL